MTPAAATRDLLAAIFHGDTRRVARLDAIYRTTAGGVPAASSSAKDGHEVNLSTEPHLRRQPDPT
jgi:hypothetical protein